MKKFLKKFVSVAAAIAVVISVLIIGQNAGMSLIPQAHALCPGESQTGDVYLVSPSNIPQGTNSITIHGAGEVICPPAISGPDSGVWYQFAALTGYPSITAAFGCTTSHGGSIASPPWPAAYPQCSANPISGYDFKLSGLAGLPPGPYSVEVFLTGIGGLPDVYETGVNFTIVAPSNPVPTITSIIPPSANVGSSAFVMTVDGTNFINSSVVNWNGAPLPTTFVDAATLEAAVPAIDVAAVGSFPITVFNPAPGGGTSNSLPFTVISAPTGAVNVSSTNSVTGALLQSSWAVVGSAGDNYNSTNVSQATYPSAPIENYTVAPVPNSAGTLYALQGVKSASTALKNNENVSGLLSMLKWFVPEADADTICGVLNPTMAIATFGVANPCGANTVSSLSLLNSGDQADFIIVWDPVAGLGVSSPAAMNTANGYTSSVTITNTGSAGSTLAWTAGAPTYSANSGANQWLNVATNSGSLANGASGNASQSVALSTNPAALAALGNGTYTATVVVSGSSSNIAGNPALPSTQQFTVTLVVTGVGGGGPVAISITPTPPTVVAVGVPVQVSCTGGSGSYNWTSTGPATFSSASSASGVPITVSYSATSSPTFAVTCTEVGGSGGSASTDITVKPDCSITASPTSVVPPQSSVLKWSCAPGTATSCTINGVSTFDGVPVGTGNSVAVTPTKTSNYALQCIANNGLVPVTYMNDSTTINAQGTGLGECNPGSASSTCPPGAP